MAITSASASASSFAALLKQSKFASYSPSIAQVYTTHGGYAVRGDWGVKRPLAARKRNQALLIHSIDSREQQAEFKSGESEARMVERWQETGMDIAASELGRESRLWKVQYENRPSRELAIDSEFCAYTPEMEVTSDIGKAALRLKTPPSIEATPDFNLMSEKEFDQYLERVRKLRPAFRKYIQDKSPTLLTPEDEKSPHLYRMRCLKQGDDLANEFLNDLSYQLHGSPHSQTLEPYPHRNGGLYYPTRNSFQTSLLHPPIPARFTSIMNSGGNMRVSAAGMIISVPSANNESTRTLDWNRENMIAGRAPVRFVKVGLSKAPQAVTTERSAASDLSFSAPAGRTLRRNRPDLTEPPFIYPSGLKEMSMDIDGATVRETLRSNPYPPGSIPYSIVPGKSRARLSAGPQAPTFSERIHVLDSRLSGTSVKRPNKAQQNMLNNLDALLSRVGPGEK